MVDKQLLEVPSIIKEDQVQTSYQNKIKMPFYIKITKWAILISKMPETFPKITENQFWSSVQEQISEAQIILKQNQKTKG